MEIHLRQDFPTRYSEVLSVVLCGLMGLQALKAESKISEVNSSIPVDRTESIKDFMNDFLSKRHGANESGGELKIEFSNPKKVEKSLSPHFEGWNFYTMKWCEWSPTAEFNSYPRFYLVVAVSPESKYYPIMLSGTKAEQFVKLWNENFDLIENEGEVRKFYQDYCEIIRAEKTVEKFEVSESKAFRIFGKGAEQAGRKYYREVSFFEDGKIKAFELKSQKLED